MASSSVLLASTLCALLCICSLQARVAANKHVNLTYYMFEIKGLPGTNGTIFPAAGTGELNFSGAGWGTYFVFDSPFRTGLTTNTTLLGRSTGTATVTTVGGIPDGGIQLSCQHEYTYPAKYNGSSITILGRVNFLTGTPPWECVVPGGTGYFRGYYGYGNAELLTSPFASLVIYKWSIYLKKLF